MFDETDDRKRGRAERLVRQALENETGCIGYQVVQETIHVLIRKLNASPENVRRLLERALIPLWRVNPTPMLYRRGLDLQTRYGFGFYDGSIVAAAIEAGCKILASKDLQRGQRIAGVTVVNPFV